ncbi:Thaumatin, pathogenesis-related protein [Beauveria brongniartii RCEF 3172]|uniref:Thaumatin, pathogenesis-related protein n=1 Tax=Beauveria brongniartii RCEF 3172 TaxID=1081107 RepID=A0A167AKE9_9HYPO|nr:Thaumatin, pathogenesis-related protein [Beauveria brongniartii RCEF 3172]
MPAMLSIPGAMCLALAASKPLNIGDATTIDVLLPTDGPQVPIELDPASRVPVTVATGIVPEVEARKRLSLATAHGGALDLPAAPPAPTDAMTGVATANSARITVVNSHDVPVTTVLVTGEGNEPEGNVGAGKLERGEYGIFTVVEGWSGRVALNVEGSSVTMGDESLIEGSFTDQGHAVVGDINVSYVDGFTVPALCWCNENRRSAGCSKNLHKIMECPTPNGHGSCRNPSRGLNVSEPTAFFEPCFYQGGAYTFDWDHEANSLNGFCPDEQYTCCIGEICHA